MAETLNGPTESELEKFERGEPHRVDEFLNAARAINDKAACSQARPPTVPDRLAKLGDLYRQRNAVYGDDYKRHGDVMLHFFPDGICLNTVADLNRYAVLKEIVTKVARYCATFAEGGHVDSLDDLSVYSQMLQELDRDWRYMYGKQG